MEGVTFEALTAKVLDEVLDAVVEIDRCLFDLHGSNFSDHVWEKDQFKRGLPRKWELSCIAKNADGKVVGFWIGSQRTKDSVHTHRVGTHPDFGRKGIGRGMFELHQEYVKETAATHLTLIVADTNAMAIGFYEGLEFERLASDDLANFASDLAGAEVGEDTMVLAGNKYRVMRRALAKEAS